MRIHVCEVAIRGQIRVAASTEEEALGIVRQAVPSLAYRPLSSWETDAKVAEAGTRPDESAHHAVRVGRPGLTVRQ